MTNSEQPAESSRPLETMSMADFNLLVTKTIPAPAELPPAMLEFLRQYKVDAMPPIDSAGPTTSSSQRS